MGNQHADKSYNDGSARVDKDSATRPDSGLTQVDDKTAPCEVNLLQLSNTADGDSQPDEESKPVTNSATDIIIGGFRELYATAVNNAPKSKSLDSGNPAKGAESDAELKAQGRAGSESTPTSFISRLLNAEFGQPPSIVERPGEAAAKEAELAEGDVPRKEAQEEEAQEEEVERAEADPEVSDPKDLTLAESEREMKKPTLESIAKLPPSIQEHLQFTFDRMA